MATVIFMVSVAPVTSDSATRIMAGGPVGINIIENHSMGSASSILVLEAMAHIKGMLISGQTMNLNKVTSCCTS